MNLIPRKFYLGDDFFDDDLDSVGDLDDDDFVDDEDFDDDEDDDF